MSQVVHPTASPWIVVLVGPKGSGKTTIGRMLEARSGVVFLEAEAIALRVLADHDGTIDERYARRALTAIVDAATELARARHVVVIETTGASDHADWFLDELRRRCRVSLVRVHATVETCAGRIAARDRARHVPVDPALIRAMHARTEALRWPWDAEVHNDRPVTREALDRLLGPLFEPT